MNHKLQALQYYLNSLDYPKDISKDTINFIKSQGKNYIVINKLLHRQGSNSNLFQPRMVLFNKENQEGAIWANHTHPLGGHFAYKTTYNKISSRYYWPKMGVQIREYISKCPHCQKEGKPSIQEQLNPISVTAEPFSQLGIDIKHVSTSRGGHRYIVAAICYLTKWVEAEPLRVQNSSEIALFIYNRIITTHGCPKIIISDNGKPFVSALIESVCSRFGIIHKTSSPYHPEANGLIERFNRTLGQVLRKRPDVERKDWHIYLPAVLYAYRTMKQETTKYTPFQLTYGRDSYSPFDRYLQKAMEELTIQDGNENPLELPDDQLIEDEKLKFLVDHQITQLQRIRNDAFESIKQSQEVQKKAIDRKILAKGKLLKPQFELGDLVEVYKSYLQNSWSGKLEDQYEGVYSISQESHKGTYKIKNIETGLEKLVHGNKLKIYKLPDVEVHNLSSRSFTSAIITENDQGIFSPPHVSKTQVRDGKTNHHHQEGRSSSKRKPVSRNTERRTLLNAPQVITRVPPTRSGSNGRRLFQLDEHGRRKEC